MLVVLEILEINSKGLFSVSGLKGSFLNSHESVGRKLDGFNCEQYLILKSSIETKRAFSELNSLQSKNP